MAIPQKNKPAGKVPVKRPRNPNPTDNQGNTASQAPVDPNPRDSKRARTEPNPRVHDLKMPSNSSDPSSELETQAASLTPGEYLEFIFFTYSEQDLARMSELIEHAAKNLSAGTGLVFNFWKDIEYCFAQDPYKGIDFFVKRQTAVLSRAAEAMPVGTKFVLVLPGVPTPLELLQKTISHLKPGVTLAIDLVTTDGLNGGFNVLGVQYEDYLTALANLNPDVGLEFIEGTPPKLINGVKKARRYIESAYSCNSSDSSESDAYSAISHAYKRRPACIDEVYKQKKELDDTISQYEILVGHREQKRAEIATMGSLSILLKRVLRQSPQDQKEHLLPALNVLCLRLEHQALKHRTLNPSPGEERIY